MFFLELWWKTGVAAKCHWDSHLQKWMRNSAWKRRRCASDATLEKRQHVEKSEKKEVAHQSVAHKAFGERQAAAKIDFFRDFEAILAWSSDFAFATLIQNAMEFWYCVFKWHREALNGKRREKWKKVANGLQAAGGSPECSPQSIWWTSGGRPSSIGPFFGPILAWSSDLPFAILKEKAMEIQEFCFFL